MGTKERRRREQGGKKEGITMKCRGNKKEYRGTREERKRGNRRKDRGKKEESKREQLSKKTETKFAKTENTRTAGPKDFPREIHTST